MKKIISNFQCRNEAPNVVPVVVEHVCRTRPVISQKLDEKSKRVVRSVEYRTSNSAEEMNRFCVNDFALENLLAVGAPLSSTSLSPDKFAILDKMETIANTPITE